MTDPTGAGVKAALLLEYRCRPKGCLLLRVWQTPNGPEFFAHGHALSDRYKLARSFERVALAGYAVAGTDVWGGRDWAGRLDDYPALLWVPLMCDHVHGSAWVFDIRQDLVGATPGKPARILWPKDTPKDT